MRSIEEKHVECNSLLRRRCIEAESEVAVLRSRLEQADAENVRLARELAALKVVPHDGAECGK